MMYRRLSKVFKEFGWRDGTLYLASRALEKASGARCRFVRYYIVAQPVPAVPQAACRPSATDVVVPAGPQDARRFTCPRPPEVIARRFAEHHRCLMALSKERFAGFLWLAQGHYDEDEVRCRYVLLEPDKMVWDYDVTVEPMFRMGRTFARLWDHANATLAREGVRWSLSRISAFNPQSIHAHGRMGTVRLHVLNFLCLGPIQFSFMSCRPFVHLGVSVKQIPQLILSAPRSSA